MIKQLPSLRKEYEWLKEVDSCSLRCAIFNLEDSYKNFFSKRSGVPIYKIKCNKQSYKTNYISREYKGKKYSNIELDIKNNKIKLPKLGLVNIRGYRNLDVINGKIINVTVVKETTGKYYVNVKPKWVVGIDLGVKDLIVTSSGEKYKNPKEIQKFEKRIKRLQRKLSRQAKSSKNYNKTKIKIAKQYSKLKNSRKHNIIKIVNKLIEDYDIIISEKLDIKEMTVWMRGYKDCLDSILDLLEKLEVYEVEQ